MTPDRTPHLVPSPSSMPPAATPTDPSTTTVLATASEVTDSTTPGYPPADGPDLPLAVPLVARNTIFNTWAPQDPLARSPTSASSSSASSLSYASSSSSSSSSSSLSPRQALRLSIPDPALDTSDSSRLNSAATINSHYHNPLLDSGTCTAANTPTLMASPSFSSSRPRQRSSSISSIDLPFNDIICLPSPIVSTDLHGNVGIFRAFNGRSPPPITSISRFPTIRRSDRGRMANSSLPMSSTAASASASASASTPTAVSVVSLHKTTTVPTSTSPIFINDLSLGSPTGLSQNSVIDLYPSSVHTPTGSPSSPDSKRSISDYVPTPIANSLVNTPGLRASNSPIVLQKSPTIEGQPIVITKRGGKKLKSPSNSTSPSSSSSSSLSSSPYINNNNNNNGSALPMPQHRSVTYNFSSTLKHHNLTDKSRTPTDYLRSRHDDIVPRTILTNPPLSSSPSSPFSSSSPPSPSPSSISSSAISSPTYTTLTSEVKVPTLSSSSSSNVIRTNAITRRGPVSTAGNPHKVAAAAAAATAATAGGMNEVAKLTAEKENIFDAYDIDMNKTSWRAIRTLGRGAFSKVVLAIPHKRSSGLKAMMNVVNIDGSNSNSIASAASEARINDSDEYNREMDDDNAVAIKITNVTAAGGASRDRIESGLMRELDILKNVQHPSLIRLLGFNMDSNRALFVLPYCRGGDLFILASQYRNQLTPPLIRRILAELIQAVMYLHNHNIVHRDIKLDNVLINMPIDQLLQLANPERFPKALITLTDLGLSRIIDPDNPMLTTRCGSEDYVPPELLMGQPYDGRQTDVWALGVLTYAIMEGRLPFDAPKNIGGGRSRGRTAHRIARVEWSWINFKDDSDAIWDRQAWNPAKAIVEGCLRKRDVRLTVSEIAQTPWISNGLTVHLTESYCCIPDALSNKKWI